jgi:hypothetical protein
VLGQRELAQRLGLPDPLLVVADRLVLGLQVEAEQLLGGLRDAHRGRADGRHAAEVVDLLGDGHGVAQLLLGVLRQLLGDGHVLRALDHLRVHDVGDDRLILPRQILVEQLDQPLAGDRRAGGRGGRQLLGRHSHTS